MALNLLGTIYGGNWEEKSNAACYDELMKDLDEANADCVVATIVTKPMQRANAQGVLENILDRHTGKEVMANSIVLTLASRTEKDVNGKAKVIGQSYLNLSRKSSLNIGDVVDIKTIRKIEVERDGKTNTYYDCDKLL